MASGGARALYPFGKSDYVQRNMTVKIKDVDLLVDMFE